VEIIYSFEELNGKGIQNVDLSIGRVILEYAPSGMNYLNPPIGH
jgi:hypothetical protein